MTEKTTEQRLDDLYIKLLHHREKLYENPKTLSLEEAFNSLLEEHEYLLRNDILLTVYLEHVYRNGLIQNIFTEEGTLDLDNFFMTNDAIHLQRDLLLKIVKKHNLQDEYLTNINKILLKQDLAIDDENQTTPRANTTFEA